MDFKNFYLATDIEYALDLFRTYVAFIEKNWNNITGRPTGNFDNKMLIKINIKLNLFKLFL